MVRRDISAVHRELRIAVTLTQIAKHLIVSAVLFNDQEYVLDTQRFQILDTAGRLQPRAVSGLHLAHPRRQLRLQWRGNLAERSLIRTGIECALMVVRIAGPLDADDAYGALQIHRYRRR